MLNEVRELLDQYYVRPENLDDQSLFEAAVNGMLAILNDTGTFYVTPDDYQTSTTLTGSFEGIGATVSAQGNDIVIVAPIEDTPAARAGLVSGDAIRASTEKTPLAGRFKRPSCVYAALVARTSR